MHRKYSGNTGMIQILKDQILNFDMISITLKTGPSSVFFLSNVSKGQNINYLENVFPLM